MKKTCILVVEDNLKNMRLVNDILTALGYQVLQAFNGEEGIKIARNARPDLILMDIQIPGIDGLKATEILKTGEDTKHIPIIALTAMAMKGDRDNIIKAGCNDYLPKPIRFDLLVEMLKKWQ